MDIISVVIKAITFR